MANLPETPDYPEGVYQIETRDPVLGGPGGIANRQAEQLGNRTAWLKDKVDAFLSGAVAALKATKLATARTLSINGAGSGSASFDGSANANITLTLADSGAVAGTYPKVTINSKGLVMGGESLTASDIPPNLALAGAPSAPTAVAGSNTSQLANTAFVQAALAALVDSSPIALNTLNELAAALGDDPNFATTMANLLASKAPLASPVLSGNPTGPTAPQFDNDQSLMTTAFAKRMGVEFSSFNSVSASTVLTAGSVGGVVSVASAAPINLTLPAAAGVPNGASLFLVNAGTGNASLLAQGADITTAPDGTGISITIGRGDSALLVKVSNEWRLVGGSVALKYASLFSASITGNGYRRTPSGDIEQWGLVVAAPSGSNTVVTLPTAYTVGVHNIGLTFANFSSDEAVGSAPVLQARASGLGTITVRNLHTAAASFFWTTKGR